MADLIVITAGGTGGHVFPAQALCEHLISLKQTTCLLVIDNRSRPLLGENPSVPLMVIPVAQLRRNKVSGACKLLYSTLLVLKRFLHSRPKLVIGFGGYACLPTLAACMILRIPIILHEANTFLGRTNRLLLPWSRSLLLGFADTKNIPPCHRDKICVVGTPIRRDILNLINIPQPEGAINILVLGGSQGAQIIDQQVTAAICALPADLQSKICLTQQTRPDNIATVRTAYQKTALRSCHVMPFFDDVGVLMQQSHLVIARAGAGTISELATLGRASVLIPFARAADNHQQHNADYMQSVGAAEVVTESAIADKLLPTLLHLLSSLDLLCQMGLNAKKVSHAGSLNLITNLLMQ